MCAWHPLDHDATASCAETTCSAGAYVHQTKDYSGFPADGFKKIFAQLLEAKELSRPLTARRLREFFEVAPEVTYLSGVHVN